MGATLLAPKYARRNANLARSTVAVRTGFPEGCVEAAAIHRDVLVLRLGARPRLWDRLRCFRRAHPRRVALGPWNRSVSRLTFGSSCDLRNLDSPRGVAEGRSGFRCRGELTAHGRASFSRMNEEASSRVLRPRRGR